MTSYRNKILLCVVDVSVQHSFILVDFHEVKTLLFNHLTPPVVEITVFYIRAVHETDVSYAIEAF